MLYEPLPAEEVRRVIEGRGRAKRVPLSVHMWTYPETFAETEKYRALLAQYPCDVQSVFFRIPDLYRAPADDPSYRWCWHDEDRVFKSKDNAGFLTDWDTQEEMFFADFPSADYAGLCADVPAPDGRYRLGRWWYCLFERFWSIRGMENALTDFYLYPDKVHRLFGKLTDFYVRMIERGREEFGLDGIFTSDDLGTQTGCFFSPEIFDEFFYPYYKRIVDRTHALNMHFWLHTCGNIEKFLPKFIDLGIDVIHPIQKYTMDEREIARKYGSRITIWAGFDVQRIIPYGTPDEVRREVRYLFDTYSRPDGRFMFTLGNGATADTPYESLKALLEEAVKG